MLGHSSQAGPQRQFPLLQSGTWPQGKDRPELQSLPPARTVSRLLTSATTPFCHGDIVEYRGHREDRTGSEQCMTLIREVTARGPDQPPYFLKLF